MRVACDHDRKRSLERGSNARYILREAAYLSSGVVDPDKQQAVTLLRFDRHGFFGWFVS